MYACVLRNSISPQSFFLHPSIYNDVEVEIFIVPIMPDIAWRVLENECRRGCKSLLNLRVFLDKHTIVSIVLWAHMEHFFSESTRCNHYILCEIDIAFQQGCSYDLFFYFHFKMMHQSERTTYFGFRKMQSFVIALRSDLEPLQSLFHLVRFNISQEELNKANWLIKYPTNDERTWCLLSRPGQTFFIALRNPLGCRLSPLSS